MRSSIEQLRLLTTCTEIRRRNGSLSNGIYHINPDGHPFKSVEVQCNMALKNGVGVTMIGHDSEKSIKVIQHDLSNLMFSY